MSITSSIPCGSDAIIFGTKIFLVHSSVFQISHDKKSSVFEKDNLNRRGVVFSPYQERTLSELTYATGRKREEDGMQTLMCDKRDNNFV